MTEQFKILTPREHARQRMGVYIGSSSKYTTERFVKGVWREVTYIPAILKIIDEIIDNSVDEFIRTQGKHANKIYVDIEDDLVTVTDNGRGIPQDMVVDQATGEELLRPVAAWTRVNAGTSFSDDRVTIGANGLGSSVTNFVSSKFIGQTWQKGKSVTVTCEDGANKIDVYHSTKTGSGTKVSFTPEFNLFECDHIDEFDTLDIVEDRLINLKMSFPEIEFRLNGKVVGHDSFKKYSEQYGVAVVEQTKDLSFLVASSNDGFRSNSYINGVNTRLGGSYVDLISYALMEELVPAIKKKYKVDVSKSTVKSGLTLIIFARNFQDPRYDSQTKERLTSTAGKTKDHYVKSGCKPLSEVAKRILATPEIIDPIVEAELAKKIANDRRAATLAAKKAKKVRVAKHIAASSPEASLFLVEGDSALGAATEVRDTKLHGFFPLRGVVKNTWELTASQVYQNKELFEVVSILGLDATDPNSWEQMSYKNVNIMTDADVDGQKIITLLVAFFTKFWPGLVEAGRLRIVRSPVMISKKASSVKWFYDLGEAVEFKDKNPGYGHRYLKGLGSLQSEEYKKIINEPVLDTISKGENSDEFMEMMFGISSEPRKQFMFKA